MEERDKTSKEQKRNPMAIADGGYEDRDFKLPVLFFRWLLGLRGFVLGIRRKRNQSGREVSNEQGTKTNSIGHNAGGL